MRAWVAAIAVLSVLALGAGYRRDASHDHGTNAHAVLVSKVLAKRRTAPVTVQIAVPPRVVLAATPRTFVLITPPALPAIASLASASRPGARAPPCA